MTNDLARFLESLPAIDFSEGQKGLLSGGQSDSSVQPMDAMYCATHVKCTDTNPSFCLTDKSCQIHVYCILFSRCGGNPINSPWNVEVCTPLP